MQTQLSHAERIIQAVADYHKITPYQIRRKDRHKRIAFPRQVCMFLLRKHARLAYYEIGRLLGGRDHSTVIHGCRVVVRQLERPEGFRPPISEIEAILFGKTDQKCPTTPA